MHRGRSAKCNESKMFSRVIVLPDGSTPMPEPRPNCDQIPHNIIPKS